MGGGLNLNGVIPAKAEGDDDEEEELDDRGEVIVSWQTIYRHKDVKVSRGNPLQTLQKDHRGTQ